MEGLWLHYCLLIKWMIYMHWLLIISKKEGGLIVICFIIIKRHQFSIHSNNITIHTSTSYQHQHHPLLLPLSLLKSKRIHSKFYYQNLHKNKIITKDCKRMQLFGMPKIHTKRRRRKSYDAKNKDLKYLNSFTLHSITASPIQVHLIAVCCWYSTFAKNSAVKTLKELKRALYITKLHDGGGAVLRMS